MNENKLGIFELKWRSLAIWSVVVALISLTALAVVATVREADTLSVIALALAVLAFVVQINLYIVQNASAAEHAQRSGSIYSQTIASLAKLDAKSEGTRETVGQINDRLLEAILPKAISEATYVSATDPTQDFSQQIVSKTQQMMEGQRQRDAAREVAPQVASPQLSSSSIDAPISPEQLQAALEVGKKMSTIQLYTIDYLGRDQQKQERRQTPERIGLSSVNSPKELHSLGLIEKVPSGWRNGPVFRLTPTGLNVARALISESPDVAAEAHEMRKKVGEFEARVLDARKKRDGEESSIPVTTSV